MQQTRVNLPISWTNRAPQFFTFIGVSDDLVL
jgi:hypothetical protein